MHHSESEVNLLEFSIHPPGGWLRYKRDKFGITGPQLAAKLGVSKQRISALEKAEVSGAASLKTMRQAAEALGCEFVYALIPKRNEEVATVTPITSAQFDPLDCMQSRHYRGLVAAVCKSFQIKNLGVYGSAARAELQDHSDINLLVEFAEPVSAGEIEQMELQFGRLFGRKCRIVGQDVLDEPSFVDVIMPDLKLLFLS